jgi:signal peptidase I
MDMIQENRDVFLYSTAGGSMFPLIRWREYVIVKKIPAEALQPGDVVVFREEGGGPVCHRIVKIEFLNGERWFRTRGDQHEEVDAPVSEQAILGKVIAVRKKYGLLEPSSPEWSSYSDPREHRWARSLFYLKNLLKRVITFLRNPSL